LKIITIKTFDNYFTANICLTRLQSEGIECYLKDEYTVTIDPILTNAIGGIKLVVKEEEETEARNLLKIFDEEYAMAATCPKCGSHSFTYIAKPAAKNYITAILTWLFSSYAIAPDYIYQCESCGYECERLPENETDLTGIK
jgi:hypothetical protein